MANFDRVFNTKIDNFFISKGGKIVEDSRTVITVRESSSEYLREFGRDETKRETKRWAAFSFGHGAMKIRANGKGLALLYTATEELAISVVELKEEFDNYLLLFEEEIHAAEEEARQREEKRQQEEAAARLQKKKEEDWDKEVPMLFKSIKDKEVLYNKGNQEYKIVVTTRQKYVDYKYKDFPCICIANQNIRFSEENWEFWFETPDTPLMTGGMFKHYFDKAPEEVKNYGELYEYIKTH